ncbi:MAG: regulatory protein RecX [Clostridia bacterium]|nr:regulatory protein RecX [Clostridia bacterium]
MDQVIEIKRKGGVATVRFLSGETVRVPSALYLERRLHVNQSLEPEAYRQYARQRGYPHALEAAMKFLALRERSCQEVRQRLKRSCYDESTVTQVLDTLKAHHLVSDSRFAGEWVAHRARKYGKNRIAQELRVKGVSREEAQAALERLDEEEEFRQAVEQGRRMARRLQNDAKKIAQALVRRGYAWGTARRAAEKALEDRE